MSRIGVLLLAAALSQVAPADRAVQATATISGIVVTFGGRVPVRHALITVSPDVARRDPVLTDGEGRFRLAGLPPGRYVLTAAKPGFANTRYGARRLLDPPRPIELGPGVTANVEIALVRGAAISGRILDDLGEPRAGVPVSVNALVRSGSRVKVTKVKSVETDDLGEYRIGSLAAGRYIVSAGPVSAIDGAYFGGAAQPFGSTVAPLRSYYPGVASYAAAQVFTLHPGDELSAIDFVAADLPPARLTVSVADPGGGTADAIVELLDPETGSTRGAIVRDGAATFERIQPGDWLLNAGSAAGSALLPIALGPGSSSVAVQLSKGASVTGRISFEGTAIRPGPVLLEAVSITPFDIGAAVGAAAGKANEEGTFAITGIVGARIFRVRSGPPGWRLKSLAANGRSLLDGAVSFAGNEVLTGAEAVLTSRHSHVSGSIAATDVDGPVVVAFPVDPARLENAERWTRCVRAEGGRFTFDDLPEGDYFAVAVTDIDESEWATPAYVDRLRPFAVPFHAADSGAQRVVLPAVVVTP